MEFRKINDTKIKCTITREELEEKGVEITDFFEDRDKIEEFVHDVLDEATRVLDLQGMGHMYSVQMSPLPEGGISMIISSEDYNIGASLEELGKRLEGFKELMEEAKKHLGNKKQSEIVEEASSNSLESAEPLTEYDMPLWVRVENLDVAISLAKHLGVEARASALYRYDDAYYLSLFLGAEQHEIAEVILIASEFSEEIFCHQQGGLMILEHGEPVITEDAVSKLRQI